MASDLGLHCLPMSNKKDARLIWVNQVISYCPMYWSSVFGPIQLTKDMLLRQYEIT